MVIPEAPPSRHRRRSNSVDLYSTTTTTTKDDDSISSSRSSTWSSSSSSNNRRHSLRSSLPIGGHLRRRSTSRRPKRSKSLGIGASLRSMLTSSRSSNHHDVDSSKRRSSTNNKKKKNAELNIFCSDVLVSTEFCLSRMEYAQKTSSITKLELEDLIERHDQTLFLEVRDVMVADKRKWVYIRFVDHLYELEELEKYERYLELKHQLWRLIEDDSRERDIPIQFQSIMEIQRGSKIDYVINFLQRLNDSSETDVVQSIEFAGAMFGCLPLRIPNELEDLCKKGYLRETVVLKVSYRNIPTTNNTTKVTKTTTDIPTDANTTATTTDTPHLLLPPPDTVAGNDALGELLGDDELGDNSVLMGKARSVHVLAACIDQLRELVREKDGNWEQQKQSGKREGKGKDSSSTIDDPSDRFSHSLSDLNYDEITSTTGSLDCTNHSIHSSASQKIRRRSRLKRNGTTGELSEVRRRRRSSSLKRATKRRQSRTEEDLRRQEKRNSDTSSASSSDGATNKDVASSLEKLSTVRKGMQKRSIQRRSSMGYPTSRDGSSSVCPPREQQNSSKKSSKKNERIPRKLRINRSRSIDGSVTRTRLHTPSPPPTTTTNMLDDDNGNGNDNDTMGGSDNNGAATRNTTTTTKRRNPPLSRNKSLDSSAPIARSPSGTLRRMRRPVQKAGSAGGANSRPGKDSMGDATMEQRKSVGPTTQQQRTLTTSNTTKGLETEEPNTVQVSEGQGKYGFAAPQFPGSLDDVERELPKADDVASTKDQPLTDAGHGIKKLPTVEEKTTQATNFTTEQESATAEDLFPTDQDTTKEANDDEPEPFADLTNSSGNEPSTGVDGHIAKATEEDVKTPMATDQDSSTAKAQEQAPPCVENLPSFAAKTLSSVTSPNEAPISPQVVESELKIHLEGEPVSDIASESKPKLLDNKAPLPPATDAALPPDGVQLKKLENKEPPCPPEQTEPQSIVDSSTCPCSEEPETQNERDEDEGHRNARAEPILIEREVQNLSILGSTTPNEGVDDKTLLGSSTAEPTRQGNHGAVPIRAHANPQKMDTNPSFDLLLERELQNLSILGKSKSHRQDSHQGSLRLPSLLQADPELQDDEEPTFILDGDFAGAEEHHEGLSVRSWVDEAHVNQAESKPEPQEQSREELESESHQQGHPNVKHSKHQSMRQDDDTQERDNASLLSEMTEPDDVPASVLEEDMNNSISLSEMDPLCVSTSNGDDDDKSLVERFGLESSKTEDSVGSSSTLTMDGSHSLSSIVGAPETLMASSSSTGKTKNSSKGKTTPAKSASVLPVSPSPNMLCRRSTSVSVEGGYQDYGVRVANGHVDISFDELKRLKDAKARRRSKKRFKGLKNSGQALTEECHKSASVLEVSPSTLRKLKRTVTTT